MKKSVRTVVYLLMWVHLFSTCCCASEVTVFFLGSSPVEPINGENATLACVATNFNHSLHRWKWQRRRNGTLVDVTTNERITILPPQQESPTSYSSTLAINRLVESDEETYLCIVVDKNNTRNILSNGAGEFYVNNPNEFPVCYPEGPANVTEGDRLSCKTVVDERMPEIRAKDKPAETTLNWIATSINDTEPGSSLDKNATVGDDGAIFDCYSILRDTEKTLSCRIGPLAVTPLDPPPITTGLPIAAIAGIGVGGLLLLLLLLFAVCCGCNPKRCCRPKSYFLNFTGIFGSHPKEDEPEGNMEMGQDNLGVLPSSPAGEQRMFSFEGSSEDNPSIPATEPNVYANHVVPGPSTSQFVADPNENWHEINLKAELSQALDEEDEDD